MDNYPKYKLVNRLTGEIICYGDDNTITFGGEWGKVDEKGQPFYIWQENIIAEDYLIRQKLNYLDSGYQPLFEIKKQAWLTAMLDGDNARADKVKQEYADLKADYTKTREGIMNA